MNYEQPIIDATKFHQRVRGETERGEGNYLSKGSVGYLRENGSRIRETQ